MKTALLLTLAALAFAGCGSDGDPEKTDFETIEEASALSAEASEQAESAIEALAQADTEAATSSIDEARELAERTGETLNEVESAPTREVFKDINALTIEGYEVLRQGIDAAAEGDETATDRYIRKSLEVRDRKLELFNRTDFEAIGAGESNEKIRQALIEQIQSEAGG